MVQYPLWLRADHVRQPHLPDINASITAR